MHKKTIIGLITSIASAILFASPETKAAPFYECVGVCAYASGFKNQKTINIYIQKEFASLINLSNGDNIDITDQQLRNLVRSSSSIWNLESNAPQLVFKGSVTPGEMPGSEAGNTGKCLDIETPAVFIQFRDTCKNLDCQGFTVPEDCASATIASVHSTCDGNVAIINFWGKDANKDQQRWGYNPDRPNTIDFTSVLIHEFGHTLGIGHHYNAFNHSFGVMGLRQNYASITFRNGRHLSNKDVDCANDLLSEKKESFIYSSSYDIFNQKWSIESSSNWRTERGSLLGSHFVNGSLSVLPVPMKYPLTPNSYKYYANYSVIDSTPGLTISLGSIVSNANVFNIQDNSYGPPLWGDLVEDGPYSDGFILYPKNQFIGPSDNMNTPVAEYEDIDFYGSIIHDAPQYYLAKTSSAYQHTFDDAMLGYIDSSSSTGISSFRSHLPISSTWDPVSQKTIFAGVETTKQKSRESENGRIFIHPGFSSNGILNERHYLPPSSPAFTQFNDGFASPYSHLIETEARVGIACGSTGVFNCFIFWSDRGSPNQWILYTLFRVTSSGDISFYKAGGKFQVYQMTPGETASTGVDAAFFDGTFWVTWIHGNDADVGT